MIHNCQGLVVGWMWVDRCRPSTCRHLVPFSVSVTHSPYVAVFVNVSRVGFVHHYSSGTFHGCVYDRIVCAYVLCTFRRHFFGCFLITTSPSIYTYIHIYVYAFFFFFTYTLYIPFLYILLYILLLILSHIHIYTLFSIYISFHLFFIRVYASSSFLYTSF